MKPKKAEDLGLEVDMSDEAIERRWREIAQLHRLGAEMKSAVRTGQKARDTGLAGRPEAAVLTRE